jgi:hypothetical protein
VSLVVRLPSFLLGLANPLSGGSSHRALPAGSGYGCFVRLRFCAQHPPDVAYLLVYPLSLEFESLKCRLQ